MDSPGFLAGAVGEGSHHRFPSEESLGGLSAADVHDAGCGGGGREPGERMASVAASQTAVAMEGQGIAQGDGVRAAAAAAPTLAHRCFLYQPVGHVLLPVQRFGWIYRVVCTWGLAGCDEEGRVKNVWD